MHLAKEIQINGFMELFKYFNGINRRKCDFSSDNCRCASNFQDYKPLIFEHQMIIIFLESLCA
jgi:hypothetical protein